MAKNNIRIGVIPVGGKGTRLGWLGTFLPKSLVPLGQKPILYHIIKNMQIMGIDRIYLLVNYKSNLIKKYLKGENEFKNLKIKYVKSEPDLGLADVILKTERHINESFITILGDDFTKNPQLKQFIAENLPNDTVVLEAVCKEENPSVLSQTCEIQINSKNQIIKAIEKPKKPKSKLRGCGIYLFTPQIFDLIRKTKKSSSSNKREITDTINLAAQEKKAYAWHLKGINININTQEDLEKATKFLYFSPYK
jgi:bifunctional UDP-N-acetylglucosamine pyrophosphorylase/glucosamine-1-phosphate N-acetyltransferase